MGFECGFKREDDSVINSWCSSGRVFDDLILECCDALDDAEKCLITKDTAITIFKEVETYLHDQHLMLVFPASNEIDKLDVEDEWGERLTINLEDGFYITKNDHFDLEKYETFQTLRETLLEIIREGKNVYYYRSW